MSDTPNSCAVTHNDRMAMAIDRHVTVTYSMLTRGLAAALDALDEPRAPDPELAHQRLGFLVETLLGVAVGGLVARVVSSAVRSFGSDFGYRAELQLREALRTFAPDRPIMPADVRARDPSRARQRAPRPLLDELDARLRSRLARVSGDHRIALIAIARAIPAARTLAFTSALAILDDDPTLSALWAEHLSVAWRYYAFALTDARNSEPELPPALAAATACTTWRAWLRRVRRKSEPMAPDAGRVLAITD